MCVVSESSSMIYYLKSPTGFLLTYDPWLTFRCQMTRSVPGGQRGSSKDPAEMSALWGNNSATFHHFIVISLYLSSTGHTRDTGGRTGSQQPKRKGWGEWWGEGGHLVREARGNWSFKLGWGLNYGFLKYHTIMVSSPPMRQTKNRLIRQKTQQKREK